MSLFNRGKVSIADAITGNTVNVGANSGLDINVQDQHTRALDLRFIKAAGAPTTLTAYTV